MAEVDSSEADQDPLQSTADIIEAARRPLVVARHKDAVLQAMEDVGDALLDVLDDIPQLVIDLIHAIADDDSLHSAGVDEGVIEHVCIARENGELAESDLTTTLGVIYRHLQNQLATHQGGVKTSLSDLKTLSCGRIARLNKPVTEWGFGSINLSDALVYTQSQGQQCRASLRLISHADGADPHWQEASGEQALSRELEEPLEHLPDAERRAARLHLVRDRIRHRFFKKVFLIYFDRDTLDPEEIAAHPTILSWLEAIADTPHLFPFMQGQTQGQKIFRLRELWRKVIQLNELYQRVAQASMHPTYREPFAELGTRERLSILANDRYPAIKVDTAFSICTALCPFAVFAKWVQDHVTQKDFVLPPEPKRRS